MISNIDWNDTIKKEARGINGEDLGEVQDISGEYVITQKGIAIKHRFYLPKNLVTKFDGDKLWLKITETDMDQYKKD